MRAGLTTITTIPPFDDPDKNSPATVAASGGASAAIASAATTSASVAAAIASVAVSGRGRAVSGRGSCTRERRRGGSTGRVRN